MINVIVVEDRADLRAGIVRGLNADSFAAAGVGDGAELFLKLLSQPCDIVLLDLELPGTNGAEILRQLRSLKQMQALGIIILTAHADLAHRLNCIEGGADAFLVKPVEFQELTAYIKNVYKRLHSYGEMHSETAWCFHQSEWRLATPTGSSISLSHLEAAFMKMLLKSPGKPVRRRDIITLAFGLDPIFYDNRRLEAVVSRLRRKLHDAYPLSNPIKVVHSVGYVFTDNVRCE